MIAGESVTTFFQQLRPALWGRGPECSDLAPGRRCNRCGDVSACAAGRGTRVTASRAAGGDVRDKQRGAGAGSDSVDRDWDEGVNAAGSRRGQSAPGESGFGDASMAPFPAPATKRAFGCPSAPVGPPLAGPWTHVQAQRLRRRRRRRQRARRPRAERRLHAPQTQNHGPGTHRSHDHSYFQSGAAQQQWACLFRAGGGAFSVGHPGCSQ